MGIYLEYIVRWITQSILVHPLEPKNDGNMFHYRIDESTGRGTTSIGIPTSRCQIPKMLHPRIQPG